LKERSSNPALPLEIFGRLAINLNDQAATIKLNNQSELEQKAG
jgi:hypothetical protein